MAHLGSDLQHGIENGELRLHYQPMMDLADDTVVGVEALARWDRGGAGLLTPAESIEVAERTGQIIALGTWVTRTACVAAAELQGVDRAPFSVSINVSAR
jgi:EAL domain-containing protein (putative c-di-GMP-specific phosphodiesterase class I)